MWTYTSNFQDTITDGKETFIPCDLANNDYRNLLESGVEIAPYAPPPVAPIKYVVSPRQFRLALHEAGLLTSVETWISAQPLELRIAFEYSTEFCEDDPQIISAALALGLTEEQKHDFFLMASLI